MDRAERGMPMIERGAYVAVRRTLEALWYGGDDPLGNALAYARRVYPETTMGDALGSLLDYAVRVADVLASAPEGPWAAPGVRLKRLLDDMRAQQQELRAVHREYDELARQYRELLETRRRLRTQLKARETEIATLRRRLAGKDNLLATLRALADEAEALQKGGEQ